jgi:hypothetical protein
VASRSRTGNENTVDCRTKQRLAKIITIDAEEPLNESDMKFRLITTVWGERFADHFLRITVRSLLAEGNLDALVDGEGAAYSIFTTHETVNYLRASPLFQQLEKQIKIDFLLFGDHDIDPKNPASHWIGWRRGAETAKANSEIALFIIADMLYPSGTLKRWKSLFQRGFRAIWTSTTQVVLETALAEIEGKFPRSSLAPISIGNEEIMDLAIRHLHPLIICMFRDTRRASRHPEAVFAEVPQEGMAERAIASHPMCVDPNYFSMSDAFCPLDRFEAIAFEQPTGVALEPLLKAPDLYARVSPIDSDRICNMGAWFDYFCSPSDLIASTHTYRFSSNKQKNDAAFRQARLALGFYACQVRITGAIYRVIREMRRSRCTLAAQIAATAHYTARLRRKWRIKGPVTIFVPDDNAIEVWGSQKLDALLMVGNEERLAKAVLQHVVAGKHEFGVGDKLSFLARRLDDPKTNTLIVERSARVIAGPIQCDDCTMYVIDDVLVRHEVITQSVPSNALPGGWSVHPARMYPPPRTAKTAEQTNARRDGEMEKSTDELAEQDILHTMLRRVVRGGRIVLRIGYRSIRVLPGAAGAAERVKWLIVRVIQRAETLYRKRRATAVRKGIAAVSMDPARAEASSSASLQNGPSAELIEAFCDLQRARAVLTLSEVFTFYKSKVPTIYQDLAALRLVEACIRESRITEESIKIGLTRIVDEAPNFAEAWYELGDMHLARREYAKATDCLDRSLITKPALAVRPGYTSFDALAAVAKGSALQHSGLLDIAAETYRGAIVLGVGGIDRVAYARLLRRLGRLAEAGAEFEAGMESDSVTPMLPPMPQDFSLLRQQLLKRLGADVSNTNEEGLVPSCTAH